MKKRTSRANTILDYDDLLFLEVLDNKVNGSYIGLHPEKIQNIINCSRNSLIIHIQRLEKYGFIKRLNSINPRERFEGKPILFFEITEEGSQFFKAILKTPSISNNLIIHKNKLGLI